MEHIDNVLFLSIGEQKATNALKEAANVLAESPSALQLSYASPPAIRSPLEWLLSEFCYAHAP